MKADQAWQATLGQLEMDMPKAAFDTWVRNAEYISYEDGSFIIGVDNAYARDWLQNRLASTTSRLLSGMMNRTVEINFVVWQGVEEVVPQGRFATGGRGDKQDGLLIHLHRSPMDKVVAAFQRKVQGQEYVDEPEHQ